MPKITHEKLLEALNWRYATKLFDSKKKIPQKDWETLEEVLRLSCSSFGLQPWKFLVIDDPAVRQKLQPATWGQTQVVDASHLVVFTVLRKTTEADIDALLDLTMEVRGVTRESLAAYRGMMTSTIIGNPAFQKEWSARQAYLAFGSFMTAASLLEIDVCPIEGLEPAKYDEILGLTDSPYTTISVAAAGYRSSDDKYAKLAKVRFAKERVIKHV